MSSEQSRADQKLAIRHHLKINLGVNSTIDQLLKVGLGLLTRFTCLHARVSVSSCNIFRFRDGSMCSETQHTVQSTACACMYVCTCILLVKFKSTPIPLQTLPCLHFYNACVAQELQLQQGKEKPVDLNQALELLQVCCCFYLLPPISSCSVFLWCITLLCKTSVFRRPDDAQCLNAMCGNTTPRFVCCSEFPAVFPFPMHHPQTLQQLSCIFFKPFIHANATAHDHSSWTVCWK